MKLGIFDSGIGGEAVARDLKQYFPQAMIISVSDREHLPYGSKTDQEIMEYTDTAIQPLLSAKCDVIVIACNTATSLAIEELRRRYKEQLFIGVEPMIRTASKLTSSGIICVCATPATLRSQRYDKLKKTINSPVTIIEPDCHDWAEMIENHTVNQTVIANRLQPVLDAGCDVIVLGCTHYHWISDYISQLAGPRVQILEPTLTIAERISRLVTQPSQ